MILDNAVVRLAIHRVKEEAREEVRDLFAGWTR
jgi:hypothetical protein